MRALLAALALAAVVACMASATPAQAYRYEFSCTSCAQVNGPEINPNNDGGYGIANRGWNSSGKGLCSAVWENLGGGVWKEVGSCSPSATELEVYDSTDYAWGHGQTRRYYAAYLYNLGGVECDYIPCD